MNKRKIERAVRKLMVDKEGGEMRQIAMNLKQKFELSTSDATVFFLLIL